MIAEKSHTAQLLIEKVSPGAAKVGYIKDDVLTRALMYLEKNGFPNNKVEDYKYCNLDAILKREFKSPAQSFKTAVDLAQYKLQDAVTIVLLNGTYSPELSDKVLLQGLHISSFSEMKPEEQALITSQAGVDSDAFVAFNTVFSPDGLYLRVQKNTVLRMPLHILHVCSADGEAVVNARSLVMLEEGAEATIIEHFVNADGKIFNNFLSEKILSANARLNCATIQDEGTQTFSVHTNQVDLNAGAMYDNTTITMSGAVVRNNHQVVLSGKNSTAHLNGLFSVKGNQLVDNHTLMDHRVPHCESNELYKGIMNDKSTGVFNGKIFVRKDAQKTNAYQSSKNILLSDDATINTKPQLEIYADDVKCSHGTSTGKIDENALFYLNARGIGKESARKLLLGSFANEIIAKIPLDSLREQIMEKFETEI